MGFVDWLKGLFRPKPLVRDVSRLDRESGSLDAVQEEVRPESGPLKPGHRRTVRRDPRLLPKPKPKVPLRGKRKKWMVASESRRLFAGTLRTRNRQISDLLPDEAQLQRLGLPVWRDEGEVAVALGVSVRELRFFSIHREAERVPHYVTFSIPKRNGGRRLIMAPKRRLKALQRKLLPLLVDKLPVSGHAHGFRAGRSIRTGAEPHVGKAVVLKMDLADFFPSVTYVRVRGLLISLGYGYTVAATLAALMTEAERQPVEMNGVRLHVPVGPRACVQGAPTSPGLCNAVVRRLDLRLAGLARKHGFSFTRYADDLCFSGGSLEALKELRAGAKRLIEAEGFRVNEAKTRVARRGRRQQVTGVVVNETLGLSRQERRKLRAAIHQARKEGTGPEAAARIEGKLAYLSMLNPEQAAVLRKRWKLSR
ncbi:reverse transcriptase family protein [Archangium violaceum]|uniref:reverse transcriptase family protein n=1 Tax=Archangium violaceum TaxID=83451 RepID=UPI002B2D094B|nr:reverse transcriptase family protein [Archangium gephyra]